MNNNEIYFMPTSYIEKKLRESGESELITAAADRLAMLDRETVRLEHELGAASHAYNELKQTCVDHEESYDELKDLFNKACAERDALRDERDLYADSFQRWSLLENDIRIAYDLPTGRYRAWLDDDPEQEVWADYAQHAVDELWRRVNNAD